MIKFLFFLLFTLSCSTINRTPSSSTSERHFIFLIHGIGGDPTTFGEMEAVLKNELAPEEVITKGIQYSTGNNLLNTSSFAKEISNAIKETVNSVGGFRPDDKVSMIMHSQGGIVGSIYLFGLFSGNPDFWPEPKDHFYSFITLGTPFWGAKIANVGANLKPLFKNIEQIKFGEQELKDMSFYSDVIYAFRKKIVDEKFSLIWEEIRSKVKIMQIAGKASRLNFLAPFVVGKNEYEDDGAVPIPSSRFDFLYYIQPENDTSKVIGADLFNSTNFIDNYQIIDALHSSTKGEEPSYYSEAFIPKNCATNSECTHPTNNLLIPFLKNEPLSPPTPQKITSFIVSFNIRYQGYVPRKTRLGITLKGEEIDETVHLGKITEPYHFGDEWVDGKTYRLFFTGYLDGSNTGVVKFKLRNFLKKHSLIKEISVPVHAGKTTFVDISGD